MTTVEELLCRGGPHRAGLTSVGLWCPLSLPFEYVAHGGGWVVLQHALKLFTGALALSPPRRCRPRSAVAYALPGATWHEL